MLKTGSTPNPHSVWNRRPRPRVQLRESVHEWTRSFVHFDPRTSAGVGVDATDAQGPGAVAEDPAAGACATLVGASRRGEVGLLHDMGFGLGFGSQCLKTPHGVTFFWASRRGRGDASSFPSCFPSSEDLLIVCHPLGLKRFFMAFQWG